MRGFQIHYGPEDRLPLDLLSRYVLLSLERRHDLSRSARKAILFAGSCLERADKSGQPLFLFINDMVTHEPYYPAPETWDALGYRRPAPPLEQDLQNNFKYYSACPEKLNPEQLNALNLLYDACVRTFDNFVGQLHRLLELRTGWHKSQLVITADHGQNLGDHGQFSHRLCLYDTLVRVPLLFYPAIGSHPSRHQRPVQQAHLFHTVLDMAGRGGNPATGNTVELRSLRQKVRGKQPYESHCFSEHSRASMTRSNVLRHNPSFDDPHLFAAKKSVRTDRWKYILHETGRQELYDLVVDPGECHNVAGRHPEDLQRLRDALERRLGPFGESGPGSAHDHLNGSIKQRLQDLGYM
jgi:arylsulfatase A-like enzyme